MRDGRRGLLRCPRELVVMGGRPRASVAENAVVRFSGLRAGMKLLFQAHGFVVGVTNGKQREALGSGRANNLGRE